MTSRALQVVSIRGIATVQDLGRRGAMHHGVPRGGALVPELLVEANRVAGNASDAAAIEFVGEIRVCAHGGELALATHEGLAIAREGAVMVVRSPHTASVGYLAVSGGIDVPWQLGGRGTLPVAALGGFEGRALRGGDTLNVGQALAPAATDSRAWLDAALASPIRVAAGPDLASFAESALDTLFSQSFAVSAHADRIGMRLDGPTLARSDGDDALSRPMVRGAIQVPGNGAPIVLGPDHPTTGGYPVIGVVIRADWGRIAVRPRGAVVRFERFDATAAP